MGINPQWRSSSIKINGKSDQWYRFQAPAGNKMPDKPVYGHKCGTSATGYILGGHPTIAGQVVSRQVQFVNKVNGDNYYRTVNVKVTHCGAFFVYQLPYTKECYLRYCAV